MTVEEARKASVCRICGKPITLPAGGCPAGWWEEFGVMTYPIKLTLDFGKEFSHTACLEAGQGPGEQQGGTTP